MQTGNNKRLGRPIAVHEPRFANRGFKPEHGVSWDASSRELLRKSSDRHFGPRVQRAFGHSAASRRAISLVASLAILAIVLSWLSVALRWSSVSIVGDLRGGEFFYRLVSDDSRAERILRLFALALFVPAGVFSALQPGRPRLPRLAVFLFAAMLLDCLFWCLVGYKPSEYWPELIGATSPFIFMMCLGVFAGFDPSLWPKLRPIVLAIAYGSAVLGVYYTARWTTSGNFEGSTPTIDHLQIAFWFGLCSLVLRKSSRWHDCVPALIPIALCIPMAVISNSRSFSLLAILGLLTGLLVTLQGRRRLSAGRVVAICFLTALSVGIGLWLLFLASPERVLSLNDRLTEDSRSSQYTQFFGQVPATSLIAGLGPRATYTFNDQADYEYIDNQFLFILFKFGLPVLFGYGAVIIYPGLRLLLKRGRRSQWVLGVVFLLWTLAGLGLSIYQNITVTPPNLLIILLAGWCWGRWHQDHVRAHRSQLMKPASQ
jgi:hypothetical protein